MNVISIVLTCLTTLSDPTAREVGVEDVRAQVGGIKIIGNTITRDSVIRKAANLSPGQVVDTRGLRIAERRLNRLGIFHAAVEFGNDEGEFRNVYIGIKEISTTRVALEMAINSQGEPVLIFVIEERNFDPNRWPCSLDDITESRMFRGNGQRIGFEWRIPLRQVPGYDLFISLRDSAK